MKEDQNYTIILIIATVLYSVVFFVGHQCGINDATIIESPLIILSPVGAVPSQG